MERIPILKLGDFLLVSIQVDMHDRLAMQLQERHDHQPGTQRDEAEHELRAVPRPGADGHARRERRTHRDANREPVEGARHA